MPPVNEEADGSECRDLCTQKPHFPTPKQKPKGVKGLAEMLLLIKGRAENRILR